jgi:hypothetical protein
MTVARVTQAYLETLAVADPTLRVTQEYLEALGAGPAPAFRVTQTYLEVLGSPPVPEVRVSRVALATLVEATNVDARVSRAALATLVEATNVDARVSRVALAALVEELALPDAPVLTVGATTASTVDLSWTNVADETGYRIERSLDGVGGWVDLGDEAADATTFTDTGLTCETEYFYRVFAFSADGDSPASNVDSGTTLECPDVAGANPYESTYVVWSGV